MLMVCPALWQTDSDSAATLELMWVRSADGQTADAHGCDVAALLPHDDDLVLVLPVLALSWHRVVLPKINAARLRQALDGLLEDRLLAEPVSLHLALQSGLGPGQAGWLAACDRDTLNAWLTRLQTAGRPVTRITPELWPQAEASWHALTQHNQPWLVLTHPCGVVTLPLQAAAEGQSAANTAPLLTGLAIDAPPRRSEPACVALAEAAMDAAFEVEPTWQRLLRSGQSPWNLAQFDLRLSAGARRSQRAAQGLRNALHSPAWRPARMGLLALLLSLLAGVNLLAWQEQRSLEGKKQQVNRLLTQNFPAVTLVMNAPVQMQREVAALQRASGSVTHGDLESLLQDISASTHDPVDFTAIEFANTESRFKLANPADPGLEGLRQHLQQRGWHTQYNSPTLSLQWDKGSTGANRPLSSPGSQP